MPYFEEPLLYEQSEQGRVGVDITPRSSNTLKTGLPKRNSIGLPEVSEPQVVRHFTRLSQQNFAIDSNFYPLGSCTMKHNPRLNEKLARLDGFSAIHPLQEESTIQGALELIYELQNWLKDLTGLAAVTLNPSAGAHGELTGAMMIRKAHEEKGNPRKYILIPDSAHGTNPATASMCGYACKEVPSINGLVDMDAFHHLVNELGDDIAAFMLTNPNTCGLFEPNIKNIADTLHSIGAYFYCDGANFNAIMGRVKPSDLGIDVMQLNLHKSFSTPHGGGGPGSGPVAVSADLEAYLPKPIVKKIEGAFTLDSSSDTSIGRIRAFHGQFGMMVRALAYMQSHGIDGLRQAAEDAVLNANYILSHLKDTYNAPYNKNGEPCMHECLLNDKHQRPQGLTTNDIAKALIDKGYHPMTVYFPLVIQGAMLVEPTESETKETIDNFIEAMIDIARTAKTFEGDKEEAEKHFHTLPSTVFRTRLDEVTAARKPKLSYWDLKDQI